MPDVNQGDIDRMLEEETPSSNQGTASPASGEGGGEGAGCSPYDFSKPIPYFKGFLQTLELVHQEYADLLGQQLSAFLQGSVTAQFQELKLLSYWEWVGDMPKSTCFASFSMLPLSGQVLIQMDSSLAYPMLHRILGGEGKSEEPERGFTDLELAVAEKILRKLVASLQVAWKRLLPLDMQIDAVLTNLGLVREIPMQQLCALIQVDVQYGEAQGAVRLCLPYSFLEPVVAGYNSQGGRALKEGGASLCADAMHRHLRQIEVFFSVVLGEKELELTDFVNLKPGDVLSLEQEVKEPLLVKVGGQPKFLAQIGLLGSYKAAQVVSDFEGA